MSNEEKLANDVVEFQPDALEIRNERLPLAIRLGVWLPFFLTVLAIVWATWAQVDVVVRGNGKLVTNVPTIVMKPLEKSVVRSIDVKIGDVVKKDQILITFDPSLNRSDADRLGNELAAFTAHKKRLQAELAQQPYTDSENQFERYQQTIYRQRLEYYQERMNYFAETLSQIEASQKSREDSLSKQRERLAAVQKLEDMFSGLYEQKAASLKELIEMSITRMEMEATVDALDNELLELKHRKGSTEAERNSFIQEWRNSISEDLVTVDRNLTSVQKQYDQVAKLIEYLYLRAPCDAVVHEVAAFSPGSAVQEAEALITLIPLTEDIELECEILPQDIGKVALDASARIKLTAYPFQKHGTLSGKVLNISENTLAKGGEAGPLSYYRGRVSIAGELTGVPDNFRLIPGMEAQCEIKCGRRRVIEFVLYPLIKVFDETAREP